MRALLLAATLATHPYLAVEIGGCRVVLPPDGGRAVAAIALYWQGEIEKTMRRAVRQSLGTLATPALLHRVRRCKPRFD